MSSLPNTLHRPAAARLNNPLYFHRRTSLDAAGINHDSLRAMAAMKRLKELETMVPRQ